MVRLRGIQNSRFINTDPIYKALQQSGAIDITRWILKYTGTSSGSATEISAPTAAWDGALEEVTTVAFLTKVNSIGSEYISIPFSTAAGGSADTMHYFWFSKAEITTVTFTLTMENMTDASTFTFVVDDGDTTVTQYYVWFDKTGTTEDPTGTGTGIEADISGATTAADVAEIVKDLIHAKADVTCTRSGDNIIIVNGNDGEVVDAAEEIEGTGCTFSIEQGGDDPSATGTGHACNISGATSAADVGTIVVAAVDAVAGLSATGTATMTVESDNTGNITDAAQSGISFGTITVVRQGSASYEGGYLYIVSASADDTDSSTKHCREVTLQGFDTNGNFAEDVIKMAGATPVKTAVQFKRISHMWGSKFGSGDNDAAGNITVESSNTANCTAHLTIAAAATESGGCHIYVPDGVFLLVTQMKLFNTTNANTGATIVQALLTGFDDPSNITPDYDHLTATVYDIVQSRSDVNPSKEIRTGTDTATIICKESEVGIIGNEDFVFVMELYTFK